MKKISAWAAFWLLFLGAAVTVLWKPAPYNLGLLRGDEVVTVLPARIDPVATITISAEAPGRVQEILVSPGTTVTKGQQLATIESPEARASLELARARHRFARNRRAEAAHPAEHQSRMLQEQLDNANQALDAARQRLELVPLAAVQRHYSEEKSRLDRIKTMVQDQLATRSEMDEAQSRELSALRELTAEREHLSRLIQEKADAESLIRRLTMQMGAGRAGEVEARQHEFDEAQSALDAAEQRMRALSVTAERPGTVLRIDLRVGDPVFSGTPMFRIADLSQLTFEVPVSAKLAQAIHPGSAVSVRLPTDPPSQTEASISSVTLVPDQDRKSHMVHITIPNPKPDTILAGLEGAVEFKHLGR
jgi:multidrug efflux pump subunit AcrA (membrane-fusion protein)